ncbi:MAG: tRNA (adenosine(37)-N6)-threonylcarbamoyltransferase complex dimerization subunit type 1 TsaB [Phycisphaerae bacterium]|nr:tRNA (adenosine(37)-N6)-threonylcarbamoyltransferase complex dimerization subunit type 1 TsaB [Saprospiraceae bacterium]
MAKILLIETSSEVCSTAISVDGVVVALSENLDSQSHAALLTLQIRECSETAGIPLAQLDAVALSRGPGAYTALRVGASVAKGICYALEKPLIALDTLLALAHASRMVTGDWEVVTGEWELVIGGDPMSNIQYPISNVQYPPSYAKASAGKTSNVFIPALDARRQEVWLAVYDEDLREIAPAQPLILENNMFEKFVSAKTGDVVLSGIVLAGNGMEKIRSGDFLEKVIFSGIIKCSARYLAALAEQYFQIADFQDIAYFEPIYMKPPNITTPTKAPF